MMKMLSTNVVCVDGFRRCRYTAYAQGIYVLARSRRKHVGNLEPNHYRLLYEEDLPGSLRVEEHTAQLDKGKSSRVSEGIQKR
ncbi:hypothetical protein [Acetomicrobium sp.]|uniref:hypothetical protein n=1 Tax=Acetomicrobium sp. TaxID=1872099 RepID=UPI002FCB2CCE